MACMDPRHVAALALVGWYLMVPPLQGAAVNITAPIAKWEIKQSFDSAARCDDALTANQADAREAYIHPEIQQEPKD